MGTTIKVLSLNMWGVPFASKKIKQRSEHLIEHLLASEYQIVSLQEVFTSWHAKLIQDGVKVTHLLLFEVKNLMHLQIGMPTKLGCQQKMVKNIKLRDIVIFQISVDIWPQSLVQKWLVGQPWFTSTLQVCIYSIIQPLPSWIMH